MNPIHVSDENPNEVTGGGGCLCHEVKGPDTKGPFLIFVAAETANNLSPHAVVCAACVGRCEKLLTDREAETLEAEAVEVDADDELAI